MQLTTPVDIPNTADFHFEDSFMLLGSCFTENMAKRMRAACMLVCENPFGELYNPMSIAQCLRWINSDRLFTENDVVYHNGLHHSMLHHGSFSSPDLQQTLDNINHRLQTARQFVKDAKNLHFIVTFGSAYVYERNNEIVGNCHKIPEKEFNQRLLEIEEITHTWPSIISDFPNADFLFTVSPIRYKKYGMHGSQLSKATLLLAVNQLKTPYFPAYEIMMDELRDYRFYAEDMIHPSNQAVDYIWQCFKQACFSDNEQQKINEAEEVYRLVNHKVLHPDTLQSRLWEQQKTEKINNLKQKYPWIEKLQLC